jgi:hypothetical protein
MPKCTPLLLIGAHHSYFTAKARSYLRRKGKQGELWDEAIATADIYKKLILPTTTVNFIPVLVIRNTTSGKILHVIQDTSNIIDYVEEYILPTLNPIHPPNLSTGMTSNQRFVSYLLEFWADEWLKFEAMHYRWSPEHFIHNEKYLLYEWGRCSHPNLSADERDQQVLNTKLKGPAFSSMKKSLPILGVNEKTMPMIHKRFLRLLQLLEVHFRQYPYLLGDVPCLGDFALMGPFLGHLFQDPSPALLIRKYAPAVCEWIERMNGTRPAYSSGGLFNVSDGPILVDPICKGQFGYVEPGLTGTFLPHDEIPPMIMSILHEFIFNEMIPSVLNVKKMLETYVVENNVDFKTEIPRVVGFHEFTLKYYFGSNNSEEVVTSEKGAFAYDIWMLQRVMDQMSEGNKTFIRTHFQKLGEELLVTDLDKTRVRLVGNRLFRDPQKQKPGEQVQGKL